MVHSLREFATDHPGGWGDILDFLSGQDIKVPLKKWDMVLHWGVKALGKEAIARKEAILVNPEASGGDEWMLIEDITHPISGVMAGMLHSWLLTAGYPVPGDDDWLKPCTEWSQP